jgi:hypothetical protein
VFKAGDFGEQQNLNATLGSTIPSSILTKLDIGVLHCEKISIWWLKWMVILFQWIILFGMMANVCAKTGN